MPKQTETNRIETNSNIYKNYTPSQRNTKTIHLKRNNAKQIDAKTNLTPTKSKPVQTQFKDINIEPNKNQQINIESNTIKQNRCQKNMEPTRSKPTKTEFNEKTPKQRHIKENDVKSSQLQEINAHANWNQRNRNHAKQKNI